MKWWIPRILAALALISGLVVGTLLAVDFAWKEYQPKHSYPIETSQSQEVIEIADQYYKTHVYIRGVYDCDDMACDLWNMFIAAGMEAKIAAGNLDMRNEDPLECNHAWVLVKAGVGDGYLAVEPTSGEVFDGKAATLDRHLGQYWEAYGFDNPLEYRTWLRGRS